jgi:hypothetical protein
MSPQVAAGWNMRDAAWTRRTDHHKAVGVMALLRPCADIHMPHLRVCIYYPRDRTGTPAGIHKDTASSYQWDSTVCVVSCRVVPLPLRFAGKHMHMVRISKGARRWYAYFPTFEKIRSYITASEMLMIPARRWYIA